MVLASRLIAVLMPGSSPMRRLREEAKAAGRLIDATHGRKCRAMLLVDSGHLILSAVQPDTLCQRYEAINLESENFEMEVVSSAN